MLRERPLRPALPLEIAAPSRSLVAPCTPGLPPSRRELEVLELVAEGHSNAAIARTLGLGEETVKRHLRRLLFKLEARNRVQLVTNGVKRGFIR